MGGPRPERRNPLSPLQTRLLQLLANGHSRREIAERLRMAEETVKWHLKQARIKTGRHTVLHVVVWALRNRWIK